MTVKRMDHVGVNVDDLEAATAFFVALGLEVTATWSAEGAELDRIVGLEGARTDVAMLATPDGHGRIELIRWNAPRGGGGDPGAPPHAHGIRHLTFEVDDVEGTVARLDAELVGELIELGGYKLCYVRGPEGIILEIAETLQDAS